MPAQNSRVARLKQLLAEKQKQREQEERQEAQEQQKMAEGIKYTAPAPAPIPEVGPKEPQTKESEEQSRVANIQLNEKQELAVSYGEQGREFCLIGAAGSGKTTTSIAVIKALCHKFGIDIEKEPAYKKTVSVVTFTRRASRNSAKNLQTIGAGKFCITIHKFLEYAPEYYAYMTEEGHWKKTMSFEPQRNSSNPIYNCRLVIVEESSMPDYYTLYKQLREAAPNAIFIFIGDLNQLPPVFGSPTLGHMLAELPVIELTHIYRQALDSPIVHFQHNFTLKGKIPTSVDIEKYNESATPESGLEFIPFKQSFSDPTIYSQAVGSYMIRQLEVEAYNPDEDTILIPYGKSFGSVAINEYIAEHLGQKRNAVVWEIKAGFNTKYLAVGDFVMYEKAECTIIDIEPNPSYFGEMPLPPSENMTRTGLMRGSDGKVRGLNLDYANSEHQPDYEKMLEIDLDSDEEAGTRQASASVTVQDINSGNTHVLSTVGEVGGLDFGYAMTIHKSQGSEWRKVWLIVHKTHANMLCRELLYTGMTRAKQKLTVLYSPSTGIGKKDSSIAKAIKKAKFPGTCWQDKVKYFQDK